MRATARCVVGLLVVTALAAVVLRILDAVPRVFTGLPRGATLAGSIDALRAQTGLPLPMPSYYPAHLEWPPGRAVRTPDGHTVITARHTRTGQPWLILATAPDCATAVAPALLPAARVLQDVDAAGVPGVAVRVQRLGAADGGMWHQASWMSHGRLTVVRYRGSLADLMRMANSLRARSGR